MYISVSSNSGFSGTISLYSIAEFEQIAMILCYTIKYKVLSNSDYNNVASVIDGGKPKIRHFNHPYPP